MKKVPYFIPFVGDEEKRAVAEAVSAGYIQGDGVMCREAEKDLRRILNARQVFLTTSGTHALELALMALKIRRGDEVICPSFTFVSTANAIVRQGAKVVFAEIDTSTLNIDIDDVMKKVTKRTRAVIPVHYAGFSCDMERLVKFAKERGIAVVEDAAQAIGASFNGRALGTFGELGCMSFHSTKNITCGEGGAVIVNSPDLDEAVQVVREKGTNRFLFMEGKIDKYTWVDVGSSFVVSDALAALLSAQLKKLKLITEKRRLIYGRYEKALLGLEEKGAISLARPLAASLGNGHIFWFLLRKGISRKSFIERLKSSGIVCTHHYVPLHSSPFGRKYLGYRTKDFPITEDVSKRLVRLPIYPQLTENDADFVIDNIYKLLS